MLGRWSAPATLEMCFACLLVLVFVIPWLLLISVAVGAAIPDFLGYWTAAKLFVSGADPYSRPAVIALERAQGYTSLPLLMIFNPPWALPLIAPFSVFGYHTGRIAWLVTSMVINSFLALCLWRYWGGRRRAAWVAIGIVATFLPMHVSECLGQVGPLMLASVTAFLFLIRSRRDFTAGLVLLGFGIKPQLLYLVFVAVVLWAIQKRKWKMLAGAALSFLVSTAVALIVNPNLMGYWSNTYHVAMGVSSGIGGVLRGILGIQYTWLQFLPSAIGAIWFIWYWRRFRHEWDWQARLPLLLMVSVTTSVYSWEHDAILMLPAMMEVGVLFSSACREVRLRILIVDLLAGLLMLAAMGLSPAWQAASSVLWIPVYVLARNSANRHVGDQGVATIEAGR